MPQYPLNGMNSTYSTPGGILSRLNLAAGSTLVDNNPPGRVVRLCVNVAGTAGTFAVYDSATVGGIGAANLMWQGAATTPQGTVIDLEFPYFNGLVVTVPTTGVVSVSYI